MTLAEKLNTCGVQADVQKGEVFLSRCFSAPPTQDGDLDWLSSLKAYADFTGPWTWIVYAENDSGVRARYSESEDCWQEVV